VKGGGDGNNEQMRFAKLVPVVMDIARAASKSDYAYEEALERSKTLRNLIETILANVTTAADTCKPDSSVGGEDGNTDMTVGHTVAFVVPPISQTKGRGCSKQKVHNEGTTVTHNTSTYKRKVTASGQCVIGSQKCCICDLKCHYSTTCLLNSARSCAAEKRGMASGGVRKRRRPRTRRSVSIESEECMEDQNIYDNMETDYDDTD
jgi:hypothetical protein